MTMSTPLPCPTHPDQDPLVQRHIEQRQVLKATLSETRRRIEGLVNEQQTLQTADHERRVSVLLGSHVPGEEDGSIRLAHIRDKIAAETSAAAAIEDAIGRHAIIANGVRQQAERRFADEIRNAAHEVAARIATHGPELIELSAKLRHLANLWPGLGLQTPHDAFLTQWLTQVRQLEAAGYVAGTR